LREKLRKMTPEQRAQMIAELGDDLADEWLFSARDAQLPPIDLDWLWLFLGGRGTGKTHAMSNAIHAAVRAGLRRIHLVAANAAAMNDVNLEGSAGLLRPRGLAPAPKLVAYKRRLEWPNGAVCVLFSGEEPDSLRGPQCELCVIDELAKMKRHSEVFDQAMLGLRLGDKPRMLIATTPKPNPFMRKLVAMKDIRITTGSTSDNAAHLSPEYLKRVKEAYEGTSTGRQELNGAMILEPEDALFKDNWLTHHDVPEELIEQVSIGVDPSGGEDTVGIVVAALLTDGRLAVLADRSTGGSPGTWGEAAIRAHDDFDADDIVVEVNYGGQMAVEVIKAAAERMHSQGRRATNMIRLKEVSASRGQVMRAEPISLAYERGRVLHRHGLDLLETEMLQFSRTWDRDRDGSPNRLDACVWALTRLGKIVTNIPIA
jgi:phage terminase large subunit-like protein